MRVLNERAQIKDVAGRWLFAYGRDGTYGNDKRRRRIGEELMALDKKIATAVDIAKIIGNDSWVTKAHCDECGNETWDILEIGEPPHYESRTAYLCGNCLRAALQLLEGSK